LRSFFRAPTANPRAVLYAYNHRERGMFRGRGLGDRNMLFILYYIVAITILVLHFTGLLARYNLEWLVLVLAATVFPAVLFL